MKNKHSYSIVVNELSVGKHFFTFEIDDAFFGKFEEGEVKQGKLEATMALDRKSSFLQLDIHISGHVTVACDRCLDDLSVPVAFHGEPIVKFATPGENNEELLSDDEDMLWIDPVKNELDLTQYFYDSIMVSLPIQRIHAQGKCNKEMIEKLKAIQAAETNNKKNLPFQQLDDMLNNND